MILILFILYVLLFCRIIVGLKFFKDSGLATRTILALFMVRVLAMIIGSMVNIDLNDRSDSINLNLMGIEEFHILFSNPHEWLVNIFDVHSSEAYSRLFDDSLSFWNNLRTNIILKMLTIFNLFSLKSFWINTLFFNFLVFFGSVALYRVFINVFPKKSHLLVIAIFLLPSALYFTAEIHRDGLIFLALAVAMYQLYFLLHDNKASTKRLVVLSLFLILIFLLRNFVFVALVPALVAWIISYKFPRHVFLNFAVVYVVATILFFSSGFISSRANLPAYVSARQQSFLNLGSKANSIIAAKPLEPDLKGFILNAPEALDHALLRPYLTEIKSLRYIPFAIEIFVFEILFLLFLFFKQKKITIHPVVYFGLFFSGTMIFMIGYTIPIIGAIVRYRSIFLIFFLIPILCYTDWKKIPQLFNKDYASARA